MKKFFTYLFVAMGVLFLLQLIALAYLFIVDPLNIKPFIFKDDTPATVQTNTDTAPTATESSTETAEPALSPAQSEALETVGLSSDASFDFTPEQQACFETKLGAERVAEIKAGAVPTFSEFNTAKECM